MPIYLIFNSSYGISPYVGSGFELPLLESRMWQVDENRFQMKSPSGWLWIFQRTKDPNVLEGNAGWKGLIKDDNITVWAPCGDKIAFKNGKIVSMQSKNEKFNYAYKGNRVESIQKNGRAILEVNIDDKTGDVMGISLLNTRDLISLQQAESRPMPVNAGGISVVNRVDKTLSEVTKPDGSKERFEFGLDANRNPTLKYDDREYCWNPATKTIIREGEWNYGVEKGKNGFTSAAINRSNSRGESQYWSVDGTMGKVTIGINGVLTTSYYFTSGIFSGDLRRREQISKGKTTILQDFSYDEQGRVIRALDYGFLRRYKYDSAGNIIEAFQVELPLKG